MAAARHELKYFLSVADAPALMDRLGRTLTRDAHGDAFDEYTVCSLYFDDAFNSAYHDKMAGDAARDKYRIRLYNGDERVILLERKRKAGDLIEKTSARITRRLADQLIAGDPNGLTGTDNALLRDLFVQMRLKTLRAKVLVTYERTAFLHPAEHVRVTLDKRVRAGITSLDLFNPDAPAVGVLEPSKLILEVKYDRYLPDYIAALLSIVPTERSAISKYALCRPYAP